MAKHKINELVRCEYCGEDYSATYRRCPFCNDTGILDDDINDEETEYDEEEDEFEDREEEDGHMGGRRLAKGRSSARSRRRVFRVIGSFVAVGLLIAIVLLVLSIVRPLLNMISDESAPASSSTTDVTTSDEQGTGEDSDVTDVSGGSSAETGDGEETQSSDSNDLQTGTEETQESGTEDGQSSTGDHAQTGADDSQSGTDTNAVTAATSLTLSSEDFTLFSVGETYTFTVTLTPAGSTGSVTWESEDPSVATVDSSGKVTAVGKGTTTISAMLANGATKVCIVRCSINTTETGTTSSGNSTNQTISSDYTLNNTDFTLRSATETYQLKVKGYDGSVTWASTNESVAKVSSDGTVSPVANGTCNVKATLANGESLTCIVRVYLVD